MVKNPTMRMAERLRSKKEKALTLVGRDDRDFDDDLSKHVKEGGPPP
jgi:hypothetical protein